MVLSFIKSKTGVEDIRVCSTPPRSVEERKFATEVLFKLLLEVLFKASCLL